MPAPTAIRELVERFAANRDAYHAGSYNETQLRREFLDPFFKTLGWDVDNTAGYAEAYKDVIHEDSIRIGAFVKAPDYCFRIGGARKFFLEAKKPAVDIKGGTSPAFQLRRYAWSAKLPLSILSDFEEFAVYDCRGKPAKDDPASTARVFYCTCREFEDKWEWIASVFSREAVLKGSFDKYAETNKAKRGTAEVDDDFLATIEGWRGDLARNLALRNPQLSQRELNFAVQRIIDRIIFLRICEDRGIENYGRLQALAAGEKAYPRLCELFRQADQRYNSGLFHFKLDPSRNEPPDDLTTGLEVDDKLLHDLLAGLYYPESPYEFSVLSADILGQVYEQFLGKVIRLTAGHQAKIEEKPEVRKAGGVYYTPTYIVDYIVKNTVGKLLEGKTPKQVETLRILDMACGSGSFLIGAYQFLLDWHLGWYLANDPERCARGRKPALVQTRGGWHLTIDERKRILLNGIYGVDIDAQAVEVTKLSLLLKVLEGETQQTLQPAFALFHERALPDLGSNIKCGNSLIGSDFYQQPDLPLLDLEETLRLNAFDWDGPKGFPAIMKAGGFDAVIGNPPYVRIQAMREWAPAEVDFYKTRYAAAGSGSYDLYAVFVERGLSLLNAQGRLGIIVPHKFFNAKYGAPLREMLSGGRHVSAVVHFGHLQVFPTATTYTCLLFLDRRGCDSLDVQVVGDLGAWRSVGRASRGALPATALTRAEWSLAVGEAAGLVARLRALPMRLGDVADIFVGLQTSADDVFILDAVGESANRLVLHSKSLGRDYAFESDLVFPLVSGVDVTRYCPLPRRQYIVFPYMVQDERASLITIASMESAFPETAAYMRANQTRLEEREKGRFRGAGWHRFGRNQNIGIQNRAKLCVPRLVDELCAAYDRDGTHFLDNVDVGGLTLKDDFSHIGLPYILGLLNSRLLRWFFPYVSAPFRGGWYSANRQFLSLVPVRVPDLATADGMARHQRMVDLVERMLALHAQLAASKVPQEKEAIERQIEVTDGLIDRLVYELYGLSDEDIRIVEESVKAGSG